MKYIILTAIILFNLQYVKAQTCAESTKVVEQDVVYAVNTDIPKHLKGAKITVTTADGKTSTVPAERYMVVPRVQKTVVGQNKLVLQRTTCSKKAPPDKLTLFVDAKKEYTGVSKDAGANIASISSNKAIVPSINLYKNSLIGPLGIGAGIDSNSHGKFMIGIDF